MGDTERFRALCDLLGHTPDRYQPLRTKLQNLGLGPEPSRPGDHGRSEELERLVAALSPSTARRATGPVCVAGEGAHTVVTSAVREDRVTSAYDGVAWLRCAGDDAELTALRTTLAEAMGMEADLSQAGRLSEAALRAAFVDRLCADERRLLLVLDEVSSREAIETLLGDAIDRLSVVILSDAPSVVARYRANVIRVRGRNAHERVGELTRSDAVVRLVSALVLLGERRFTAAWATELAGLDRDVCEATLRELVVRDVVRATTPPNDGAAGLPQLYRWVPNQVSTALIAPYEIEAARARLPATVAARARELAEAPADQHGALFARTRELWTYVIDLLVREVTARLGGIELNGGPECVGGILDLARATLVTSDDAASLPGLLLTVAPHLARPFQRDVERALRTGYVAAVARGERAEIVGGLAALIAGQELPRFSSALPWLDEARRAFGDTASAADRARVSDQLCEARASCGDIGGSLGAARESLRLTPADAGALLAVRMNNAALTSLVAEGRDGWTTAVSGLTDALAHCQRVDAATLHTRAVLRWNLATLSWTFGGGTTPSHPLDHPDNEILSRETLPIASTRCAAGELTHEELASAIRELATRNDSEQQALWILGALAFHGPHYLVNAASVRATGRPARVPLIDGRLGMYSTPPVTAPDWRLAFVYDPRGAVAAMDDGLLGEIAALSTRVAGPDAAPTQFISALRDLVARGESGA